jgi:hypothetical protein
VVRSSAASDVYKRQVHNNHPRYPTVDREDNGKKKFSH